MSGQSQSEASPEARKFKIVLVDDHPSMRAGLRELMRRERDLELCGEADEVAEALRLIKAVRPDLAVIDLLLREGHGVELIEQVRLLGLPVRMLVLSMHDEMLFAERVLRAGAMGYVNKEAPLEDVLAAIREILAGRIYLSRVMADRLLQTVVGGAALDCDPMQTLSNREFEVFQLIGEGLATKKIAVRLNLSRKTVEAHRERIKSKLSLPTSAELGRRAVQWVLENR